MLNTVVQVSNGNFSDRIPLDDVDDELLEIEVGFNFMLEELALQHDKTQAQQQELLGQAQQLAAQSQALVVALSTPIIMVWPGVLALPLIGHFDRERATMVTATLLDRIASERASHVILDLTGIEDVEDATIAALLSMVRAMKLLGTQCVLTGIHPRSAQQIVTLGVEIGQLQTFARVSDAIAHILTDRGLLS